jgi:hypothetical protein
MTEITEDEPHSGQAGVFFVFAGLVRGVFAGM